MRKTLIFFPVHFAKNPSLLLGQHSEANLLDGGCFFFFLLSSLRRLAEMPLLLQSVPRLTCAAAECCPLSGSANAALIVAGALLWRDLWRVAYWLSNSVCIYLTEGRCVLIKQTKSRMKMSRSSGLRCIDGCHGDSHCPPPLFNGPSWCCSRRFNLR